VTTYGTDLYGGDDLDPHMRETDDLETMVLAVWRILQTPKGALLDDPDYGIDMVGLLSVATTGPGGILEIPPMVEAAIRRAEPQRIVSCTVRVVGFDGKTLELEVRCIGANGPFDLVVGIDRAKALLLGSTPQIQEAA
jgi:phage baseplate assembly protein W